MDHSFKPLKNISQGKPALNVEVQKLTLLEYIAECTRIHENKYDYSQVIYKMEKVR